MEVNLPNIFSEDSSVRNAAFSIVTEILQHAPRFNVSLMKLVLGRYYDEKGGDHVHLDSAKKAIEIMTMACKLELPSMLQATRLIHWPCSNSKNQPTTPMESQAHGMLPSTSATDMESQAAATVKESQPWS